MSSLQSFMAQLESTYSDEQWARVREREAERLSIEAPQWSAIRSMKVDLVMVREAHRSVTERAMVRRADRDGEWVLSPAQPGKLRSQPQSFRVGAHIDRAWDHTTLRHQLAELVNTTRDEARSNPVHVVARFLRRFAHAQPFVGQNEKVALVVASSILRAQALPALHVHSLLHDRRFEDALIARDDDAMMEVVSTALWSEALQLAEWLAPGRTNARWTLADEHAAASSRRSSADLLALASEIRPLLPSGVRVVQHDAFADRVAAATRAFHRGHPISPQHSIVELRWELHTELDGVLVLALPGRGLAMAVSAHASIEHSRVVRPLRAPGLLLPITEPSVERAARLAAWLPTALHRTD